MAGTGQIVKATRARNRPLTIIVETVPMARTRASGSLSDVRAQLGQRIADLNKRAARLSPLAASTS